MKFGEYARRLRRKAGLSQNDVAKAIGLKSGQLVSNWERGESFIPLKSLKIIAREYQTPLENLFSRMIHEKRQRDWRIVKGGK